MKTLKRGSGASQCCGENLSVRDRQTEGQTNRWMGGQTDRQKDRQTDEWVERQTDRQTDRQAAELERHHAHCPVVPFLSNRKTQA